MSKKKVTRESLINTAIDASTDFEKYMESIDFNSYLLDDEEKIEISATSRFKTYNEQIRKAKKEIDKGLGIVWENDIITNLFNAKAIRLKARQLPDRKEEKNRLFDAISELNKALTIITPENFKDGAGSNIYKKQNWAKVLLYNEMAICYSGLVESSISLGYADRSTRLLKNLISKMELRQKNINTRILSLYTFALYNKGEAERNLHGLEQALKTFQEIIKIYETHQQLKSKKPSDYYSACLKVAIILLDYGRGEEALKYLEKVTQIDSIDYRFHEANMEKVNAFIDMKEYNKALSILEKYLENSYWEHTFAQRKAKVNDLRLVIEFIKNRSRDFNKKQNELSQKIAAKEEQFEKDAKALLHNCVDRHDQDNFKKTCSRLAEYFHEKKEGHKTLCGIQKNWMLELRYYHLYLCNRLIFEEEQKVFQKIGKSSGEIVSDWISEKNDLKDLVEAYESNFKLTNYIEKINDEQYLNGFFYTYIDLEVNSKDFNPINKPHIIEELQKRLVRLFREKDNLSEARKTQEDYEIYIKKISGNKIQKEERNSVKFIDKYFLREKSKAREKSCLNPDSILEKMQKTTEIFASDVVGKSQRFPKGNGFRGLFTVLRRWSSFTPALTSSINPSKGGGYFLYFSCNNETIGVVIDPGYDFLENLLSAGYRIGDINAVVISHAHPDHTDSLPSILSLFHEANGRLGKYFRKDIFNKKHLKLILSQGVFDQYYSGFIKPNQESLKDVIIVKARESNLELCYDYSFHDNKHSITIEAFPTHHGDLMKWESLGFIISIKENGTSVRKIGYTSDAHWIEGFSKYFDKCNTVCAHLGSIVDILGGKNFSSLCKNYKPENDFKSKDCKDCKDYLKCKDENFADRKTSLGKMLEQAHDQRHLYLSGIAMLFEDLLESNAIELAIISEFGEELKGGIRIDLYNKFNDWFREKNPKSKCIPGDIGLEIDLLNNNIFCTCCQEFKSKEKTLPMAYGKEEAIFYICDECRSVLSSYQIGQKLDTYYENGRKLELFDESKEV